MNKLLYIVLRLNERKLQLKTVGYATLLGSQVSGGSGNWDGVGGPTESTSCSLSGTRLSEDLGDINLNTETSMEADSQPDDIFK